METRIRRFEDLIAWQKAIDLAAAIYAFTRDAAVQTDRVFVSQLRRAALSVPSNIAEGYERSGRDEFRQFLNIAKASCAEIKSDLYVAVRVGYLSKERFGPLSDSTDEVARIIGGLKRSMGPPRNRRRLRNLTTENKDSRPTAGPDSSSRPSALGPRN